jgi:hypothetical protein
VTLHEGRALDPDIILTGPTEPVVGLLLGRIGATTARDAGVTVRGQAGELAGLRPRGETPAG